MQVFISPSTIFLQGRNALRDCFVTKTPFGDFLCSSQNSSSENSGDYSSCETLFSNFGFLRFFGEVVVNLNGWNLAFRLMFTVNSCVFVLEGDVGISKSDQNNVRDGILLLFEELENSLLFDLSCFMVTGSLIGDIDPSLSFKLHEIIVFDFL